MRTGRKSKLGSGAGGSRTSSKGLGRKGLAPPGHAIGRRPDQTKIKLVEGRAVRRTGQAEVEPVEGQATQRLGHGRNKPTLS